jgi:hypothetical protein
LNISLNIIWVNPKKTLKLKKGRLQMKKTLIASAIAAATLTSNAFAMDPGADLAEMLDSMPTLYGAIQLYHESQTTDPAFGAETSSNEFKDGGTTLGWKHEHMISDGLTGFMKIEVDIPVDQKGQTIIKTDEAYVGVKGDFGMAQVGTDESVYQWVDMVDTFEQTGISGGILAADQSDNIQYVSPEIVDGLKIGVTAPIDSDTLFGGALAAQYSMDTLTVALAYAMGREEGVAGVLKEAGDTIGLAASFGIDDLTLIAQYETRGEGASKAKDGSDYMAFMAQYAMDANKFVLGYSVTSPEATAAKDEKTLYLQAMHNLSDHMYAFIEYTTVADNSAGADVDTLAIGTVYGF